MASFHLKKVMKCIWASSREAKNWLERVLLFIKPIKSTKWWKVSEMSINKYLIDHENVCHDTKCNIRKRGHEMIFDILSVKRNNIYYSLSLTIIDFDMISWVVENRTSVVDNSFFTLFGCKILREDASQGMNIFHFESFGWEEVFV